MYNMSMENVYDLSVDSACALDKSMLRTYDVFSNFVKIRDEMNRCLLNLGYSQQTALKKQQIHYLYMALEHLENVEEEIRVSDGDEAIIRLERILDKILSLKRLILEYIRQLAIQE